MSHNTYRILALLLLLAVGYDWMFNEAETIIFLSRKFVDLLNLLAFWR